MKGSVSQDGKPVAKRRDGDVSPRPLLTISAHFKVRFLWCLLKSSVLIELSVFNAENELHGFFFVQSGINTVFTWCLLFTQFLYKISVESYTDLARETSFGQVRNLQPRRNALSP